jgi:Ca2+-transporting ATPase
VLTGPELEALDETTLRAAVARTRVFARIMPEQKLRLVQAYTGNGEVVAMTGDGVNDAPALKAAHIGVAMGERGTDVAREAAGLVLLDDDFTSLVTAIRLGRRIDDNLRKAFAYILAVHVPIIGMSLIPVLLGWAPLLGPVHVVFLEMIIDPASSIVFETEPASPNIMSRPPRSPRAPLFSLGLLVKGLLQGAVVLAAAVAVFFLGVQQTGDESTGRAMAFITLVLGNLGLILSNKTLEAGGGALAALTRPNRPLLLVTAVAVLALTLSLLVPALRHLFAFTPLGPGKIAMAMAAAVVSLLANEILIRLLRIFR